MHTRVTKVIKFEYIIYAEGPIGDSLLDCLEQEAKDPIGYAFDYYLDPQDDDSYEIVASAYVHYNDEGNPVSLEKLKETVDKNIEQFEGAEEYPDPRSKEDWERHAE